VIILSHLPCTVSSGSQLFVKTVISQFSSLPTNKDIRIMPADIPPSSKETWSYKIHEPPVLEDVNSGSIPPVMRIPNESGYFPTGTNSEQPLVIASGVTLHQIHPKYKNRREKAIASGTLTLRDPAAGTASEVALVGECNGTCFYVMNDDATTKVSPKEFVLMLPDDCILMDLGNVPPEQDGVILHVEGLLAARTLFHDDSDKAMQENRDRSGVDYRSLVPDDRVSRSMYGASRWVADMIVTVSEKGSKQIEKCGQARTASITETMEPIEVSKNTKKVAETVYSVSKKTNKFSDKISDKLSKSVGKSIGKRLAVKQNDSSRSKQGKGLVLTSSLCYSEVSDGIGIAYENIVKSAKGEATSFVAKKYGEDAAQLARHTTGATVNFGRTALTARRVVNVKQMVKSNAKHLAKASVKKSFKNQNATAP